MLKSLNTPWLQLEKNHYALFSNIFYSFLQWLHLNDIFSEDSHAKILKLPSYEFCSKYVPTLKVWEIGLIT
jgi:hypothetical protein